MVAGVLAGATATPAFAKINPAVTIDGPSSNVVDIGGVAMAADGTGAMIYRKRAAGRIHIYASRFDGSNWQSPVRVDNGQDYDSFWPVIAAGRGGRLTAAWVQEGGPGTDRLWGASLGPGASSFQDPLLIDLNVGEASATYPSLSMNDSGTAYLTYRVINSTSLSDPSLPDDTVDGEIRVAKTSGYIWSTFGQPMDRNPVAAQRTPNAQNGPRVAVDRNGNAIVAWQEQDDSEVDRVWARRLFSSGQLGIPLQVSASTYGGRQLNTGADAFSLDGAGFGSAAVAYRQVADASAGLPAARIFSNSIPDAFTAGASAFIGPRLEDGSGYGALGPPSVAVAPGGQTLTAFGSGAATIATDGDSTAAGATARVDDGSSGATPDPVTELGSDGSAVFGYKASTAQGSGTGIIERRADGVAVRALASGNGGGAVRDLRLAGSGLGDGLLAWLQGDGSGSQIVGGVVDAPPQQFVASAPTGWQKGKTATITWEQPDYALGTLTYSLTVDDDEITSGLTARSLAVKLSGLDDGALTAVVVAHDSAGEETESVPTDLKVDRHAPKVRFKVRKRKLTITATDAGSGIRKSKTYVKFPGVKKKKKFKKSVSRKLAPGIYRIRVYATDKVNHKRKVSKRIKIK